MQFAPFHLGWTTFDRLSHSRQDQFGSNNQSNDGRDRKEVKKVYRVNNKSILNEKSDLDREKKQPIVDENKVQKQLANGGLVCSNKEEVLEVVGTDHGTKLTSPAVVP